MRLCVYRGRIHVHVCIYTTYTGLNAACVGMAVRLHHVHVTQCCTCGRDDGAFTPRTRDSMLHVWQGWRCVRHAIRTTVRRPVARVSPRRWQGTLTSTLAAAHITLIMFLSGVK